MKPQLSGRRNVYLGGLAAGLWRAEVDEKFRSIVAYADIGEAIDRPVKMYSQGTFSHLASIVAMAIEANISLLDEVLADGDEDLRSKSMKTKKGLLVDASTIVFVSHSRRNVVDSCDRAMWIDRGQVQSIGESKFVVRQYKAEVARRRAVSD